MHTFQPYPLNMLEWNPIKKLADEGIAIVAESNGKVNATSSHNGGVGHIWGKNVLYAFLRNTRYTKELLDESEFFSFIHFHIGLCSYSANVPLGGFRRKFVKKFRAISVIRF